MTSPHPLRRCSPSIQCQAVHPSSSQRPSSARTGLTTRNPSSTTASSTSATQSPSPGLNSCTGLSTTSPARHADCAIPPASGTNCSRAETLNASKTLAGGGGPESTARKLGLVRALFEFFLLGLRFLRLGAAACQVGVGLFLALVLLGLTLTLQ